MILSRLGIGACASITKALRNSCRHRLGATRRQKQFWLGEGLHLLEGGVGGELTEKQALRCNVIDGKLGDDVVVDLNGGERQRALFQDFRLVVARRVLSGGEY